ncbi:putative reductase [Mycobacteroides abscessus]|nr:putative reductase [Mycobacteroides abscessus]
MAIALDSILATIKDKQWALADIDWDAPGADQVTEEQRPTLKEFMSDLVWIENVGARGFAALAKKAPTRISSRSTPTFMPRSSGTPMPNWLSCVGGE